MVSEKRQQEWIKDLEELCSVKAENEKLALYKDYVESRIDISTIPMCFSEWDKCVSDAEKEND